MIPAADLLYAIVVRGQRAPSSSTSGSDVLAVRVAGWTDAHEALLLPASGAKLVVADAVPGFVGIWRRPSDPSAMPRYSAAQIAQRPVLREHLRERRDLVAEQVAHLRARFPGLPTGGRLKFVEALPDDGASHRAPSQPGGSS